MDFTWFHRLASPPHIYRRSEQLAPWFAWAAALSIGAGLYGGLLSSPPDYQMCDGYRIIYVHAPSAWLSLMIYSSMATAAAVGLIWRMKVAHAVAASCAGVGAAFTAVSLITGMLWGKPMWGAYWVWDPRLTAQLILLFLFFGYMALRASYDDVSRADRLSAWVAIIGIVNVPIVRFSVTWWNSLHQAPSVMKMARASMPASMLVPLLLMFAGFTVFFLAFLSVRLRAEILRREKNSAWVRDMVSND
jgi:heme exporter protein C